MATMTINVAGNPIIPCGSAVNAGGNIGVYELILNVGSGLGYTGIRYNSLSIPDRFQLYYNNSLVADTKFVGDGITSTSPTGGITPGTYILNNFDYNGTAFVADGTTTSVTINTTDISNITTEPSDGNGVLLFNKTTASPTTVRVVIIGSPASGTTSWNLTAICPTPEEDLIDGEEKIIYKFFNETDKALQTTSAKFILVASENKFYTDVLGGTTFSNYGYVAIRDYINDGVNWWRISATGNIIDTGLL